MTMTDSKRELMERLNKQAEDTWQAAREKAVNAGRAVPQRPRPLTPADIEYPKWLYRADKSKAGFESKLVLDEAEHKAAGAGWLEAPPTKKE